MHQHLPEKREQPGGPCGPSAPTPTLRGHRRRRPGGGTGQPPLATPCLSLAGNSGRALPSSPALSAAQPDQTLPPARPEGSGATLRAALWRGQSPSWTSSDRGTSDPGSKPSSSRRALGCVHITGPHKQIKNTCCCEHISFGAMCYASTGNKQFCASNSILSACYSSVTESQGPTDGQRCARSSWAKGRSSGRCPVAQRETSIDYLPYVPRLRTEPPPG